MRTSFLLDTKALKKWFLEEKRDLPWRNQPRPYSVWISEVMLQQTQAAVVIPYFERWMKLFPTIKSLAEAPLDTVIKAWEGLGYYSRARNLHAGAQYVLEKFGGQLPQDEKLLGRIKGLGPYTVGAIRSFAFHQRTPAVDGNVLRVLTRYFAIADDISKPKTVSMIRNLAEQLLPAEESWIINEALIEMGATVCQRKPKCSICPLKKNCQAFIQGKEQSLPIKSFKMESFKLHRAVAILLCEGHALIKRREKGEIMADLHEFPYFEFTDSGINVEKLQLKIRTVLNLDVSLMGQLETLKHSFTKYSVSLYPFLFKAEHHLVEGYQWVPINQLKTLAFSSGHRQIIAQITS